MIKEFCFVHNTTSDIVFGKWDLWQFIPESSDVLTYNEV